MNIMTRSDWMEEYCKNHDLADLQYATHNFNIREVKDMVNQLGIDAVIEEIGEDKIHNYLRNKKLNKIRNGI